MDNICPECGRPYISEADPEDNPDWSEYCDPDEPHEPGQGSDEAYRRGGEYHLVDETGYSRYNQYRQG